MSVSPRLPLGAARLPQGETVRHPSFISLAVLTAAALALNACAAEPKLAAHLFLEITSEAPELVTEAEVLDGGKIFVYEVHAEGFLVEPPADSLKITADDTGPYRKGVELIHQQMFDLLRRRGVKPIDAVGAEFDPRVHQAVTHEVSSEHREGEVMEELRPGYMLADRLLRPSMVKVAKA